MKKLTTKTIAMLLICTFVLSFAGMTASASPGDFIHNRAGSLSAGGTYNGSFKIEKVLLNLSLSGAASGAGTSGPVQIILSKAGTPLGSWNVYPGESKILARPTLSFGTYNYTIINLTGASVGYSFIVMER